MFKVFRFGAIFRIRIRMAIESGSNTDPEQCFNHKQNYSPDILPDSTLRLGARTGFSPWTVAAALRRFDLGEVLKLEKASSKHTYFGFVINPFYTGKTVKNTYRQSLFVEVKFLHCCLDLLHASVLFQRREIENLSF